MTCHTGLLSCKLEESSDEEGAAEYTNLKFGVECKVYPGLLIKWADGYYSERTQYV